MPPARRRIYSNTGIELAADLVAGHAAIPFAEYFRASVVEPLGLAGALYGSPAWGYRGPLDDLLALARELLAPTLVAPETLDEATSVQFPGLSECCRASAGWTRTTGGSPSSSATTSRRTGRAHTTRRGPSVTSARRARSSGSTPSSAGVRRADGQGVRRVGARSLAALQRLSRPRTAVVGSRRTSRGRSSRRRRA